MAGMMESTATEKVGNVSECRRYFEQLDGGGGKKKSAANPPPAILGPKPKLQPIAPQSRNYSRPIQFRPTAAPPAKPTRTFEHDHYMARKGNVPKTTPPIPVAAKMVICRPTPSPVDKTKRASTAQRPSAKPPPPPKKASEYEHIFTASQHQSLRRCASDETIYAKPAAQMAIYSRRRPFSHYEVLEGGSTEKLYYQSTAVGVNQGQLTALPFDITTSLTQTNKNTTSPRKQSSQLFKFPKPHLPLSHHSSNTSMIAARSKLRKVMCGDTTAIASDSNFYDKRASMVSNVSEDRVSLSSVESPRETKRATLVRRQTIAYQQSEANFRKKSRPQLFEFGALLRLADNRHDNAGVNSRFYPEINFTYPQEDVLRSIKGKPLDALLQTLPMLAYPDFTKAELIPEGTKYAEQYFVMISTDEQGNHKFIYCCRFLDPKASPRIPEVFALVSPLQATAFYFDMLREIVWRLKLNHVTAKDLLCDSFYKPMPQKPGQSVEISTGVVLSHSTVSRMDSPHASIGELLNTLGADLIIILFQALLCEKRIILVGNDVPFVSRCVQAAVALLAPFEWPHTLLPVVPEPLLCNFCQAPMPYVIGMLRSSLHLIKPVLVDVDEENLLIMELNMPLVLRSEDFKDERILALPDKIRNGLDDVLKSLEYEVLERIDANFNMRVADVFMTFFVDALLNYRDFAVKQQDGTLLYQYHSVTHPSKTMRKYLVAWINRCMFLRQWLHIKLETPPDAFDARIAEEKKERERTSSNPFSKITTLLTGFNNGLKRSH